MWTGTGVIVSLKKSYFEHACNLAQDPHVDGPIRIRMGIWKMEILVRIRIGINPQHFVTADEPEMVLSVTVLDGWVQLKEKSTTLTTKISEVKAQNEEKKRKGMSNIVQYSQPSSSIDVFVLLKVELERLKELEKTVEESSCDGSYGKPKRKRQKVRALIYNGEVLKRI